MTDPVADTITRIRNAYMAKKTHCHIPYSHLKQALVEVLLKEGFLQDVKVDAGADVTSKQLVLELKYVQGMPSITRIVRVSKPGRREYVKTNKLQSPLSGYGVGIISTSKGIMTDKAARKANLGGEFMCRIY